MVFFFINIFKTYRLLKHVGVRFCQIRNHFDKVKPYSSSIFINILVFYKHINTITIRMWKSCQQKFKKKIFFAFVIQLEYIPDFHYHKFEGKTHQILWKWVSWFFTQNVVWIFSQRVSFNFRNCQSCASRF